MLHGLFALLSQTLIASGMVVSCDAELPPYVIGSLDVLLIELTEHPNAAPLFSSNCLVRPNGTVSIGKYGSVLLSGKTVQQAHKILKKSLRKQATQKKLRVRVEVLAYNSKEYYVVHTHDYGVSVYHCPLTGTERVTTAIMTSEELMGTAAESGIWLKNSSGRIRAVDWLAITQKGQTSTNYHLQAGDRVYVGARPSK